MAEKRNLFFGGTQMEMFRKMLMLLFSMKVIRAVEQQGGPKKAA